jgi:aspartyl-tRNA(Asn)/glutamyl-tRNA(Gln) amidotransferase subunit B
MATNKPQATSEYTTTIGIECHVQLKTKTKLFAAVDNDARESAPNTHISHICLGMPGALPVLNKEAVRLASKAAIALNTEAQVISSFDRKHYFYPDLPKGYQITQQAHPIVLGGSVSIIGDNGSLREISLERAHLEEDAGKNTHPEVGDYSLVDLNRAGTPLLEIVSKPELSSAQEARAYAHELYLLMRYSGVSDADLYHGNMRFDVNVSVSKTEVLGTRTETKNLNSFRSVEKAVEYEVSRQIAVLEAGDTVIQETRGWNDAKQKTISQRSKEEAHDYRYFPEPDIPPIRLDEVFLKEVRQNIPQMPAEIRIALRDRCLTQEHIEILLEAELDDEMISYLGTLLDNELDTDMVTAIANLMVQTEIPKRRSEELPNAPALEVAQRTAIYTEVSKLAQAGSVSSTNAKALLQDLLFSGARPKNIEAYAEQQGYIQVSDTSELEQIVDAVISENAQAAEDVQSGEMKAIGFLVGQAMKKSHGQANPALIKEILQKKLSS